MKKYLVKPGKRVNLKKVAADDTGDYPDSEEGKAQAQTDTAEILSKLDNLQEKLYADSSKCLLIVLQAMDTGGKDGTIEHVMSGVNPQGCQVASFKVPTPIEQRHDFLWRVHKEVPPKGYIGIFNRSHYEDVLVTRVHNLIDKKTAHQRFREINDFERLLRNNGTVVIKFFLHITKDEQKRRLQARAQDPKKHWKFSINDLKERKYWDQYQKAFEDALTHTSTDLAPWYIIPANKKWYRNLVVSKVVVDTLRGMKLKYPVPAGINFRTLKIV